MRKFQKIIRMAKIRETNNIGRNHMFRRKIISQKQYMSGAKKKWNKNKLYKNVWNLRLDLFLHYIHHFLQSSKHIFQSFVLCFFSRFWFFFLLSHTSFQSLHNHLLFKKFFFPISWSSGLVQNLFLVSQEWECQSVPSALSTRTN